MLFQHLTSLRTVCGLANASFTNAACLEVKGCNLFAADQLDARTGLPKQLPTHRKILIVILLLLVLLQFFVFSLVSSLAFFLLFVLSLLLYVVFVLLVIRVVATAAASTVAVVVVDMIIQFLFLSQLVAPSP